MAQTAESCLRKAEECFDEWQEARDQLDDLEEAESVNGLGVDWTGARPRDYRRSAELNRRLVRAHVAAQFWLAAAQVLALMGKNFEGE